MWSGRWYGRGVLANSAYGVSLQFSGNFGFLKPRQDVRGFISSTMLLAAPAAPSLLTAAISRTGPRLHDLVQDLRSPLDQYEESQ